MSDLSALTTEEIKEKLKELPEGWEYKNNRISKTFIFDTIMDGIKLLDKLIPYCDSIDHHPDVHIYFKKFIFELTRFDIGEKVTARDFVVAKKIEELYKEQ
ncbi:MAG: 4a-hydroxytetrahydrobiopterin dehydratase [bacterium]|nr:4a-hydroxytetrahydrobiopterin dehydratase [bacterium]